MYCRAVKKVSLCNYFWDNPQLYQVTSIHYKKNLEPVIYTMTTKTTIFMFFKHNFKQKWIWLFLHGYNIWLFHYYIFVSNSSFELNSLQKNVFIDCRWDDDDDDDNVLFFYLQHYYGSSTVQIIQTDMIQKKLWTCPRNRTGYQIYVTYTKQNWQLKLCI